VVIGQSRRSRGVRRRCRTWIVASVGLCAALTTDATRAYSHPLHTTLTELTVGPNGVQIVVRTFIDDFSAVVTGHASTASSRIPTPADSATARYLDQTIVLTDASGHRARLQVTNVRRTDDLVWVTLRAPGVRTVTGARLTNRVLFDRWDDQVNIVQTTVGSRRQTLLFTKRDGNAAKSI